MITTFSIHINLASEVTIQQTYFYHFLMTKFWKVLTTNVYTRMILINLQKAFDTINYKILLDKLLPIGFSKNAINWYESSLAERHFTGEVANQEIRKCFMWCSARFNFKSSTVFHLCQWYEPSCRMRLVRIFRSFIAAPA